MEEFRKLTNSMTRGEKEKIDEMLQELQPQLNVEKHIEIFKDAGVQALAKVEANLYFPVRMSSSFFWAKEKILECHYKIISSRQCLIQTMLESLHESMTQDLRCFENLKERSKIFNQFGFLI